MVFSKHPRDFKKVEKEIQVKERHPKRLPFAKRN